LDHADSALSPGDDLEVDLANAIEQIKLNGTLQPQTESKTFPHRTHGSVGTQYRSHREFARGPALNRGTLCYAAM
jgi:hypothetical protein